ncbi:MAG: P1 family peptidase [Gemmatimonadota bacterium]|nr:P1 family peptidase [Gemmatimonadota bacterium]
MSIPAARDPGALRSRARPRLLAFAWAVSVFSLISSGHVSAQELPVGEWTGHADFADGVTSEWHLHLWRGADGLAGDLLFVAGRGFVLDGLSMEDDRLAFSFGEGGPEPFRCLLERVEAGWAGSCEGPSVSGQVELRRRAEGEHPSYADDGANRPRARDAGLVVGVFPPGPLNAITDVAGVQVGHATVRQGDDIRTGVTAIIPAPGDLYARPVPAWIHTVNGYGKLIGETQVREFGEIETPILLTCTLCVWSAARGLAWSLMEADPGPEHTINPVVGETNDSWLNDMWSDPIGREHVEEALGAASSGPVAEGSVGAGTGTTAFGWKGGIGTSSRALPASLGGYTVGVLVQTNFGGNLTMNGAPIGRELGSFSFRGALADSDGAPPSGPEDGGSLMIVVATDAPLTPLTIERLAERAMFGAVRTGSFAHNSSGDYVIAFSTAEDVRRVRFDPEPRTTPSLLNPNMSPLFAAAAEATEEAIYNAMLRATTVRGRGRVYKALPLGSTLEILGRYRALRRDRDLPLEP